MGLENGFGSCWLSVEFRRKDPAPCLVPPAKRPLWLHYTTSGSRITHKRDEERDMQSQIAMKNAAGCLLVWFQF